MSHDAQPPDTLQRHSAGTCVRCRDATAPDPLGLCSSCSVQLRVELAAGLRRLAEYLGRWAAFDEWCRSHGAGPAGA